MSILTVAVIMINTLINHRQGALGGDMLMFRSISQYIIQILTDQQDSNYVAFIKHDILSLRASLSSPCKGQLNRMSCISVLMVSSLACCKELQVWPASRSRGVSHLDCSAAASHYTLALISLHSHICPEVKKVLKCPEWSSDSPKFMGSVKLLHKC